MCRIVLAGTGNGRSNDKARRITVIGSMVSLQRERAKSDTESLGFPTVSNGALWYAWHRVCSGPRYFALSFFSAYSLFGRGSDTSLT
jgi:hypothetical protein